ncbi:MAG: HNH endonuclease signature motif containing protein [Anaerolineales bacterium]
MTLKKLFTDYQAKVNRILAPWQIKVGMDQPLGDKYPEEVLWLKSFLLENSPKSQMEPIYITYQGHSWYMPVFSRDLTFRGERALVEGQPFKSLYRGPYLNYPDNFEDVWLYQDAIYGYNGRFKEQYSRDEQKMLILEYADKERKKFEKLKNKFSSKDSEKIIYERNRIPEDVRIAVWRRDQGKCAKCGSRENLEYDHIVPVSKGGGNTARNIELLCQTCNRAKGDRIE